MLAVELALPNFVTRYFLALPIINPLGKYSPTNFSFDRGSSPDVKAESALPLHQTNQSHLPEAW